MLAVLCLLAGLLLLLPLQLLPAEAVEDAAKNKLRIAVLGTLWARRPPAPSPLPPLTHPQAMVSFSWIFAGGEKCGGGGARNRQPPPATANRRPPPGHGPLVRLLLTLLTTLAVLALGPPPPPPARPPPAAHTAAGYAGRGARAFVARHVVQHLVLPAQGALSGEVAMVVPLLPPRRLRCTRRRLDCRPTGSGWR